MKIDEYLSNLCKHVGLTEDQFSVEVDAEDEERISVHIKLPEEESGLFIGHHGETLQSLQLITRISFFDDLDGKFLSLNVNDYREQRRDQLVERVENAARQVLETGEPYTFPYLNSRDRFVVHSTLGENEEFSGLVSESDGEGRERYLSIRLKD